MIFVCFVFLNQQLDNALTEGEGVSVAEWEGRGRGGRGSDKAADCRESGHV